jgi:hypothetical protein
MNCLLVAVLAVAAATLAPPTRAGQQQAPATPASPSQAAENDHPLQSVGKVGESSYRWTNGWGWMTLGDDAKVSMVVGIEQGVVLSVRENWNAVPKGDQQTMVQTAARLTVGGVSFDQVVLEMDKLYLDPDNDLIPVVDAYLYGELKLKKTPEKQLNKLLDGLRKTYPQPPIVIKPMTKP